MADMAFLAVFYILYVLYHFIFDLLNFIMKQKLNNEQQVWSYCLGLELEKIEFRI